MTELILNGIWLAVAVAAMVAVPRSSKRGTIALVCVLALLFPIISASDDFSADRETLERAAVAIVCSILLAFAALAARGPRPRRHAERSPLPAARLVSSDRFSFRLRSGGILACRHPLAGTRAARVSPLGGR